MKCMKLLLIGFPLSLFQLISYISQSEVISYTTEISLPSTYKVQSKGTSLKVGVKRNMNEWGFWGGYSHLNDLGTTVKISIVNK